MPAHRVVILQYQKLWTVNKCAKNIATGKCHDEYIRNTLGTTLFPKYYAQDKQR